MNIGDRVPVTLGTRQAEVTVTKENQAMVTDGDLTNDLPRIAEKDGDATTVKAADFEKAGFDVSDRNLLARMSQGIAKVDVSAATLGKQAAHFQSIVASKPYLQSSGATPNLQQLQVRLQAMPVTSRNGVLSELATETAMLQVRDQALTAMGNATITQMGQIHRSSTPAATTGTLLRAMPGGDTPANRKALTDAVLKYPDMPLANKHAALEALGMTKLPDRNAAIAAARDTALAQVNTIAEGLYEQMGGLGPMGETHSMATGDGTGTQGLAGKANCGIAYMSYADVTASSGLSVTGANRNTMTFTPQDVTKPVPIHLSATGANVAGNEVTITRGNQAIRFQANAAGDLTSLALAPKQTLPPGVTYNAVSQTLTFPPGAAPIQVAQSSAYSGGFDEVQFNVTAFNASTGTPSIAIDFGKLFAPDRFSIDWNTLPADQQQQIERYAQYLSDNPDKSLTLNLQGKGPTDFDGTAMTEIAGYGADASGSSRAEFAGLRSSMLDVDAEAGKGTITATTDPVRSSLTNSGADAPLTAAGRTAATKFMSAHPSLTKNDVLAGLRSHVIVELIKQRVEAHGGNASQVTIGASTVDRNTPFTSAQYRSITAGQQVLQNVPPKP